MRKTREAFVMPAIMIVGTVLFAVLAYAINAVLSSRGLITTSHNQILARQAAESGIAYARSCIIQNNRVVTWTESNPLRPNTDCRGVVIRDVNNNEMSPYLLNTKYYQSSFTVKPSDVDDSYKTVAAQGFLNILSDSGGGVQKSYDYKLSAYIKTDVTFSDIVFGSLYVGSGYNDLYARTGQTAGFSKAVYFFTRTHLGNISSVGYNMDGVLTGYNSYTPTPWIDRLKSDPKEWYHTPYSLSMPSTNTTPIKKIFTDFQGNGWVAFFLGADGRTIYGTGSNINCDIGLGECTQTGTDRWSRPNWLNGESKVDLSNVPADQKIVDIFYNSMGYFLTDGGALYASGRNDLGPGLGSGYYPLSFVSKPVKINGYDNFESKKIKKFYTDAYYDVDSGSLASAITEDGELFIWGRNMKINGTTQLIPRRVLTPGQTVDGQSVGRIIDVVNDGGSVWALDDNGRVLSAGANRYGQLGRNSNNTEEKYFGYVQIPDNRKVIKMAADAFSVLFLTEDGKVYGAGLNDVSQLGFPYNTETCALEAGKRWNLWPPGWVYDYNYVPCSKSPRQYQLPAGELAKDLFIVSPAIKREAASGGANYEVEANRYRNSFVITESGSVYGAGSNYHGQLGVGAPNDNSSGYGGNPQSFNTPQKMILDYKNNDSGAPGDEEKPVVAKYVRSGLGTTIVITDLNHVFTVGNNSTGQLGSGNIIEYHTPKRHRYTNVFQTWYY